ncbi:MAG TPA: DNA-directed RNA polymerase subunit K [Candidatus Bilamarchaeaceae archaeon]|nr:DNA-directed RNA polymerase subunit K [Candidatus Bilamarchaeaceae archaeon]
MAEDLNNFELARLIGARALQLSLGAPPLVKPEPALTFIEVAKIEFENGAVPLSVLRG